MAAAGTPLWTFEPPIQRLGTEHAQLRGHSASLGRVAPGQLGRLEETDQTRALSITEAVARCRQEAAGMNPASGGEGAETETGVGHTLGLCPRRRPAAQQ